MYSDIVKPRKGKRLDPRIDLKYPNAGRKAEKPERRVDKWWSSLKYTYVEVRADALGVPHVLNIWHRYKNCKAIKGVATYLPQDHIGLGNEDPLLIAYLNDCPTCNETKHLELQNKIDCCDHTCNPVSLDVCVTCKATGVVAYNEEKYRYDLY